MKQTDTIHNFPGVAVRVNADRTCAFSFDGLQWPSLTRRHAADLMKAMRATRRKMQAEKGK